MSILVAGGAGYIGAHVVRLLQERGADVVVVDDFSTGARSRISGAKIIECDLAADSAATTLANTMVDEDVTAVIHFAAKKQVGESVKHPVHYYKQNIGSLANTLFAMNEAGVDNIIFSSSAAVYGMPPVDVVTEDTPCHPINPYGETKLIGEWMLQDAQRAWGVNWVALRYFNVAGAGWVDLADPEILNLVPMVLDRVEKGEAARIFGDDYDTEDGTCVRDYIHVLDLAKAHLVALDALGAGKALEHRIFNVGTGSGTSVRAIVEGLRAVSGIDFDVVVEGRRAGDPPLLIGDPSRINTQLGWSAENTVDDILRSAWEGWQAGPRRINVEG